MNSQWHIVFQCSSTGIHAFSPFRSDADSVMFIAPVIMVVSKQINAQSKLGNSAKLRSACQLAMLNRESMIKGRLSA